MTDLRTRFTDDMKTAMKARETARLSAIRLLLAAIKQREVDERIQLDDAAVLAREAGTRLFESLDYLDDRQPEVILEVGCGTGHNAALLKKRWPRARVIALDSALPMLRQKSRLFRVM